MLILHLGTRQAFLPGGHRTGAPGKHVIRGASKYRLLDEKVRVFVAPSIQEIQNSEVRPLPPAHCFSDDLSPCLFDSHCVFLGRVVHMHHVVRFAPGRCLWLCCALLAKTIRREGRQAQHGSEEGTVEHHAKTTSVMQIRMNKQSPCIPLTSYNSIPCIISCPKTWTRLRLSAEVGDPTCCMDVLGLASVLV